MGSTSLTTDQSGTLVAEARYLPFGEERWSAGTAVTAFGFTGQRAERGFGLLDYRARYYDPALGRFLSADTVVADFANPQSSNRYSYVLNNPVRYTDPSGHFRECGYAGGGCGDEFITYRGDGRFSGVLEEQPPPASDAEFWMAVTAPVWGSAAGLGVVGAGEFALGAISGAAVQGGSAATALAGTATRWLNYVWIRANVAFRSTGTPKNGAVFWSGFEQGNKDAAQAFARSIGGKTVEMTRAGRWLDSQYPWNDLIRVVGDKRAKEVWDRVATRFASGASGEANVFLSRMRNVPDLSRKTYFAIERPILLERLANGFVTKINEYWNPLLPPLP